MKKYLPLLVFICLSLGSRAQQSVAYTPPADSLVVRKLHWWQGLKFGLMMHWGTYSQWGVVESWSICPEDEGWTQRHGHGARNYFVYKSNYEHLISSFDPVQFNPDKWAAAAKYAGMKYLVFTTKHHDGFCMFDTRQTDYRITSDSCPFHTDPRANITQVLFKAFRSQGFGIGAYFSKPDWHSPDYWWPYFPPLDRYPNFDEARYPRRWQRFRDFTYNQIRELMSGTYGPIDILWLDGGWVRPHSPEEIALNPRKNDDVDMPRIAAMARSLQPGLIIVDRDVPGPYENYRTPEQQVPSKPLPYPWETCMTMGTSWSYKPGDRYKPVYQLIHLLVRIVSRGGNFLLNIGPGPQGDWDPVAYERLRGIGNWMRVNSSAIYQTTPVAPYASGRVYFTRKDDGSSIYGIYLADSGETRMPTQVLIGGLSAAKGIRIRLLGYPGILHWMITGSGIRIFIPRQARMHPPCHDAWVFIIPQHKTNLTHENKEGTRL